MDKVNYFFLVLVIMLRCTMNYLLPSPDTITFEILDGLAFGVLTVFLINWIIGILRSIHKINRSFMLILKLLRILSIDINKAIGIKHL